MTDREALLQCYHSGQMSAAQWERHCEDDPELRTMVEAKGGDANDRVPIQRRPEDTSPGVKTGAIGSVAAMREALKEIDARRYRRLFSNHPWLLSDFGNAYSCGSQQAHEECSDIARAALASYDAAAPSRQSAGVEAMARELAADFLIRNSTESEMLSALLSFAARVAADQRERDAKIAETPDPQLANKTAAQIAAAIRGQGND